METLNQTKRALAQSETIKGLWEELSLGLKLYWQSAAQILSETPVTLESAEARPGAWEENFFSLLFLYSFRKADIPRRRRILYAALTQCLRGMVTGCDNILDDEYKHTLETDLPETGYRFRSVLDIMVSDRVMFALIVDYCDRHGMGSGRIMAASEASLRTLAGSGAQEAAEESGVKEVLPPDDIIHHIHHYKTGTLFQCAWDIPLVIEGMTRESVSHILDALYEVGMGCQIMDDMVDFSKDLERKRHNFLISLIFHGKHRNEREKLKAKMDERTSLIDCPPFLNGFPEAKRQAQKQAHQCLQMGLKHLFSPGDHFLVDPVIHFLTHRIGTELSQECTGR